MADSSDRTAPFVPRSPSLSQQFPQGHPGHTPAGHGHGTSSSMAAISTVGSSSSTSSSSYWESRRGSAPHFQSVWSRMQPNRPTADVLPTGLSPGSRIGSGYGDRNGHGIGPFSSSPPHQPYYSAPTIGVATQSQSHSQALGSSPSAPGGYGRRPFGRPPSTNSIWGQPKTAASVPENCIQPELNSDSKSGTGSWPSPDGKRNFTQSNNINSRLCAPPPHPQHPPHPPLPTSSFNSPPKVHPQPVSNFFSRSRSNSHPNPNLVLSPPSSSSSILHQTHHPISSLPPLLASDDMRRSRPTRKAAPTSFHYESSPSSEHAPISTDPPSAPYSDANTEEDTEDTPISSIPPVISMPDHDNIECDDNDDDAVSHDDTVDPVELSLSNPETLFNSIAIKSIYPSACIKRQIQKDEDVGKIAQVVPLIVGKSVQLFMISLIAASVETSRIANTRRLSTKNLLDAIVQKPEFDFLRELETVKSAIEAAQAAAANASNVKVKRAAGPGRRKRKGDGDAEE